MPLTSGSLLGLVPTIDSVRAREFYVDTLGLRFVSEDLFAFTVVGWAVGDVRATVRDLARRGVQFLRFEGMNQDEDGIWDPTGGGGVAWFKDPDGNTLSVSGHG
jgi:catechol 2,3-dioxygenase-like lactoylglutathione lyase family enzyme